MELTTQLFINAEKSLAKLALKGALNTDTAPAFELSLQDAIGAGMQLTVLDMKELDYISSAGLRVIFKAAKEVKGDARRLAAANRQPHIEKVFEILQALPDMAVFADDEEMDDYLTRMQNQVKERDG
jgi:anti-anti-sigma factor